MSGHLWVLGLMLSPVAEARVGIPLGLSLGINVIILFSYTVITASIIYIVNRLILKWCYDRILSKWNLFERLTTRVRTRGAHLVERYGYWGLLAFVAVPLPTTGVYAGTLISWYLDMSWVKAYGIILLGAMVSGIIITLAVFIGNKIL